MSNIDERFSLINERDSIYDKWAIRSGLSSLAFRILYIRRTHPGKEYLQSELADAYYLSRKSVNSAALFLLGEGLIELHSVKGTGNRKQLVFSEKGIGFAEKWVDPIISADNESFLRLNEQEQKEVVALERKQLEFFKEELQKSTVYKEKNNDKRK